MPRAAGVSVVCEDGGQDPVISALRVGENHGHAYRMEFSTSHGADDALMKLEKLHGEMLIKGTDDYGQPATAQWLRGAVTS